MHGSLFSRQLRGSSTWYPRGNAVAEEDRHRLLLGAGHGSQGVLRSHGYVTSSYPYRLFLVKIACRSRPGRAGRCQGWWQCFQCHLSSSGVDGERQSCPFVVGQSVNRRHQAPNSAPADGVHNEHASRFHLKITRTYNGWSFCGRRRKRPRVLRAAAQRATGPVDPLVNMIGPRTCIPMIHIVGVSERAQNTGVALRRKLQNNRKQHNAEARVYRSAATSQDVRDLSLVPHPSRAGHGDTSQLLSARFGMADGYGANRRKVNSEGDGGRR